MNSQQLNWRDAKTTINFNKFPEFGCIEKSFVIGVFGDFIFGYIFNNRIPIEGRQTKSTYVNEKDIQFDDDGKNKEITQNCR